MAKGDKKAVLMESQKGQPGGVPSLGENSRMLPEQTPLHASQHGTEGADHITPASIGAASSTHKHTKNQITDFPTSMTPSAHASTHSSVGADPITPASIGAAAATHTHTASQVDIPDDNNVQDVFHLGVEGGKLYIEEA